MLVLFYDFMLVVALGGQLPFYFGGNWYKALGQYNNN